MDAYEFHYVPDEGVLSGMIFEQQTEDAINDVGNAAYAAQNTADKAVDIGETATKLARNALNDAQNAQTTADNATVLANNGIAQAKAAQATADEALANTKTNLQSILNNAASIETLKTDVGNNKTQISESSKDIEQLQIDVKSNTTNIETNTNRIADCLTTITAGQRYFATTETDANSLVEFGRYYLKEEILNMPDGITYPALIDIVPTWFGSEDDVVCQRVIDSNGIAYYRFATESTVDETLTYTWLAWQTPDTKYLKLTGGIVNGQTTFSDKFIAAGETSVPTPAVENNSETIANTKFVHAVVDALVAGAPDALNTLNELSKALGDDPNFSTTILGKIGEKESKTDASISYTAIRNEIALKQDALTFDSEPTSGSSNPVKSGGIKSYVDNKIAGGMEGNCFFVADSEGYIVLKD